MIYVSSMRQVYMYVEVCYGMLHDILYMLAIEHCVLLRDSVCQHSVMLYMLGVCLCPQCCSGVRLCGPC